MEIPERSFYGDIPNMQLYVQGKNAETGMLYGMMIYDFSRGQENSRVILADSGRFEAFMAVSSNFSPRFPNTISEASSTASGSAMGTMVSAA